MRELAAGEKILFRTIPAKAGISRLFQRHSREEPALAKAGAGIQNARFRQNAEFYEKSPFLVFGGILNSASAARILDSRLRGNDGGGRIRRIVRTGGTGNNGKKSHFLRKRRKNEKKNTFFCEIVR